MKIVIKYERDGFYYAYRRFLGFIDIYISGTASYTLEECEESVQRGTVVKTLTK